MRRLLPVAVLLIGVPLAVSAPVPKPESHEAKVRKLLGDTVFPEKGCEFRIDGNTVTAKLPKELTANPDEWEKSPRSEQVVVGDFEMTVRVRTSAPKEPPQTEREAAGRFAYHLALGGGLLVYDQDAKRSLRRVVTLARWFERDEERRDGRYHWHAHKAVSFPSERRGYGVSQVDPTDTRYSAMSLCLRRSGDTISTAWSEDGKEWDRGMSREVSFGRRVTVGIWAFNLTGKTAEVVFQDFKVTPLK